MTDSSLTTWSALSHSASRVPDRVALRDPLQTLTYAAAAAAVSRICGGLRQLGVKHRTVVALILDNHVDHALLWLSTGALGAIEVGLNPQVRGQVLLDCLNDSDAEMAVVEAAYAGDIADVLRRAPKLRVLILRGANETHSWGAVFPGLQVLRWEQVANAAAIQDIGNVDGGDIFGIVYTSGSSGKPKGVLVTHAQTYMRCQPGTPGIAGEHDVALVHLPMFHVVGLCRGVYGTLIAGGAAVLLPRFSASRFWSDARQYGATCAPMLGSMAAFVALQPPGPEDGNHPMKWVTMAPPIADVDGFRRRFGVEVYSAYGLSEAVALTSGRVSGRGTGWMRSDFDMRLVDEFDREVPAGSPGELVVRPKQPWLVTPGYHKNPEATLQLFRNQWLHTGDVFDILPDGELHFVGRKSDRIRRKGENITPTLIEDAALKHDLVEQAFAMAVPDDQNVEDEVFLCLFSTDPALKMVDPKSLRDFIAEQIPQFMVPRYIAVLSDVPTTSSEKADRVAMKKRLTEAWDANETTK